MRSTSQTVYKILPNSSSYSARIFFIDGNRYKQRGDYLNANPWLQLHDLKAWINQKLSKNWKQRVVAIEIFDNTGQFEDSRSLIIYREFNPNTKEFTPWQGTAKDNRFVLFDFPGLTILNKKVA